MYAMNMDDKILTISVAAYNVEKYIEKNLSSVVSSKYIDDIEIFVIDDGGSDHSLETARKFKNEYPDSVNLVHKENGGYGSVVNYAAAHASGRYFKLLDGDDWVDTEGLDALMEFLKTHDSDWVLTEVIKYNGEEADTSKVGKWASYDGMVLAAEDIRENLFMGMWELTIRTELLKSSLRPLPEHYLYTDILYVVYPLPYVRKIGFVSKPVYCYRLGRDGQSVTKESRNKHYREYMDLVDTVKKYYYESDGNRLPEVIRMRFFTYYKYQVFNYLLLPVSGEVRRKIIQLEKDTKENYREFYDYAGRESNKISLMRKTNYLAYWLIAGLMKNNW